MTACLRNLIHNLEGKVEESIRDLAISEVKASVSGSGNLNNLGEK
jgi:hypothetical protein